MVIVSIEEAQKRLPELLADVAGGEEVVISKNDVPLGRLLAMPEPTSANPVRVFGHFAGRIQIAKDFDAPMEDFADYM